MYKQFGPALTEAVKYCLALQYHESRWEDFWEQRKAFSKQLKSRKFISGNSELWKTFKFGFFFHQTQIKRGRGFLPPGLKSIL
jgi:hypothetical protein